MENPVLGRAVGALFASARLTDRQRIGVLFQAACAAAHLAERGWTAGSWENVRVDDQGLLSGVLAVPVSPDDLPQQHLIRLLCGLFKTEGAPAGRGQGRRVARDLFGRWQQCVNPIAPSQAVEDVLESAPFLWQEEFSQVRRCLAARSSEPGRQHLRVLGPRHFSRVMSAGAEDLVQVGRRLGRAEAGNIWRFESGERSPSELAKAGLWRAATAAWDLAPAKNPEERVESARCFYAVGKFHDALDTLKGLRRSEAQILRLWCLYRLGKLVPAKRQLKAVKRASLNPRQRMQLLAVALRILENLGAKEEADRWLAEGLTERDPSARLRADLLAAMNDWDRGELDAMRSRLEGTRKAVDADAGHGDLVWRWHKAAGLAAAARKDGARAVGHLSKALRLARRQLTPFEAGALWNELAIGRALNDDLAGAERALLHTLRLHRQVQGSRITTSALFNLAEIRVRRGRLGGVLDILKRATTQDRRSRNWRSLAHDLELWSLFELTRGKAHAALVRSREALEELADRGISWRADELHVRAARALGWLERPEDAREELERSSVDATAELEPEEIPALWALAGDRNAALATIPAGPLRRLWTQILTGDDIEASDWLALDVIEPYRAGRFVFDVELIEPGVAPPAVLRRAVVALREAGAGPLAERLDSRDATAWRALGTYLSGARVGSDELDRLFVDSGYPEVRLIVRKATGEVILREGGGGEKEIMRPLFRGELVLQTPFVDEVQKALLVLLVESLEKRSSAATKPVMEPRLERGSEVAEHPQIIGESVAVLEVLERAGLLAVAELPIIILGETGTGKELLAGEVHSLSRYSGGPFVPMNCAAVSEELLMSDLFGHVKGSFTGAARNREGVFETARDGTVFLDEIGDLPLRAQGFLLRVLQEGEVRRLGESLPRKVKTRVVTATNRDLESMVKAGTFRADLYYRLRVGALELPPLRDREDDVLILARHFLNAGPMRSGLVLSPSAEARLLDYDWPGNVRELKNILLVAAAFARDGELLPEHLDLPNGPERASATVDVGYHERVLNYRRRLVREALRSANGNRAEAARRLGLTRQALSYLVRKLELDS